MKHNPNINKDGHPTFSIRDHKAAEIILTFLSREYPHKRISSIPALSTNWQSILQENTDLIIVGGFAVNEEFLQHRSIYQNSLRLKMGRLCRTEGRHVFHVSMGNSILRGQPGEIEKLSSSFVNRDFAFVSNSTEHIYGAKRRVISIAGIKGNGTLGATQHLVRHDISEFDQLKRVDKDKKLEMIVKTDILNDVIDKTEIIEILLDGQTVAQSANPYWENCELENPCEGCKFGEILPKNTVDLLQFARQVNLKGIIFDLDDTLVDTFSMLITPLEIEAARKMAQVSPSSPDPDRLAATLLELRRKDPKNVEIELKRRFSPSLEALDKRQSVFQNIDLQKLVIDPELKLLLRELQKKCYLFLLTEGELSYQTSKIKQLDIAGLFTEIITIPALKGSKKTEIDVLMKKYDLKNETLIIIGNRLDREILAGNKTGIKTIWVRYGEGSEMSSEQVGNGVPDYILENPSEIKVFLRTILQH